jgi:hypothetical protein
MFTCPKCDRQLGNANQWHNCVIIPIDSLFEKKDPDLVLIFDRILTELIDLESVAVSATQNCIVFVHRQTFLIIRPMKKQLDIKFYSPEKIEDSVVMKSIPYSGRYENHILISKMDEVTKEVLDFLKQSYRLL